ncbi:MAG: hypothetical protein GY865_02015 [candidate division Zixibacteria bacterium]|nr:hypothetical protein [candidate division Zixibacteria bacterium]
MKKKLFLILVITLFGVSAVMAGHHGNRSSNMPGMPRAPKAPDAPRGLCNPEMGGHFGGAGKLLRLADELELNDKQISEIKGNMEKNGFDRIDRQAELKKAKLKLRHLKMNEASDNEILSAIETVGKLQTEMKKMRFIHRSEMNSILTDAQQDKLKELKKAFRGACKPGGKGSRGRGIGYNIENETGSDAYGMEAPMPDGNWEY